MKNLDTAIIKLGKNFLINEETFNPEQFITDSILDLSLLVKNRDVKKSIIIISFDFFKKVNELGIRTLQFPFSEYLTIKFDNNYNKDKNELEKIKIDKKINFKFKNNNFQLLSISFLNSNVSKNKILDDVVLFSKFINLETLKLELFNSNFINLKLFLDFKDLHLNKLKVKKRLYIYDSGHLAFLGKFSGNLDLLYIITYNMDILERFNNIKIKTLSCYYYSSNLFSYLNMLKIKIPNVTRNLTLYSIDIYNTLLADILVLNNEIKKLNTVNLKNVITSSEQEMETYGLGDLIKNIKIYDCNKLVLNDYEFNINNLHIENCKNFTFTCNYFINYNKEEITRIPVFKVEKLTLKINDLSSSIEKKFFIINTIENLLQELLKKNNKVKIKNKKLLIYLSLSEETKSNVEYLKINLIEILFYIYKFYLLFDKITLKPLSNNLINKEKEILMIINKFSKLDKKQQLNYLLEEMSNNKLNFEIPNEVFKIYKIKKFFIFRI